MQNSGGFLHGGATASLVDLVASAAFATAGLRTRGSPLEMNISYLDAAFADVSNLDPCSPSLLTYRCYYYILVLQYKTQHNMYAIYDLYDHTWFIGCTLLKEFSLLHKLLRCSIG